MYVGDRKPVEQSKYFYSASSGPEELEDLRFNTFAGVESQSITSHGFYLQDLRQMYVHNNTDSFEYMTAFSRPLYSPPL